MNIGSQRVTTLATIRNELLSGRSEVRIPSWTRRKKRNDRSLTRDRSFRFFYSHPNFFVSGMLLPANDFSKKKKPANGFQELQTWRLLPNCKRRVRVFTAGWKNPQNTGDRSCFFCFRKQIFCQHFAEY